MSKESEFPEGIWYNDELATVTWTDPETNLPRVVTFETGEFISRRSPLGSNPAFVNLLKYMRENRIEDPGRAYTTMLIEQIREEKEEREELFRPNSY